VVRKSAAARRGTTSSKITMSIPLLGMEGGFGFGRCLEEFLEN
jgi:hypothetical protein